MPLRAEQPRRPHVPTQVSRGEYQDRHKIHPRSRTFFRALPATSFSGYLRCPRRIRSLAGPIQCHGSLTCTPENNSENGCAASSSGEDVRFADRDNRHTLRPLVLAALRPPSPTPRLHAHRPSVSPSILCAARRTSSRVNAFASKPQPLTHQLPAACLRGGEGGGQSVLSCICSFTKEFKFSRRRISSIIFRIDEHALFAATGTTAASMLSRVVAIGPTVSSRTRFGISLEGGETCTTELSRLRQYHLFVALLPFLRTRDVIANERTKTLRVGSINRTLEHLLHLEDIVFAEPGWKLSIAATNGLSQNIPRIAADLRRGLEDRDTYIWIHALVGVVAKILKGQMVVLAAASDPRAARAIHGEAGSAFTPESRRAHLMAVVNLWLAFLTEGLPFWGLLLTATALIRRLGMSLEE
ncbi:hypothetical protein C8J57DRAFT_1566421 [Mycena rebaudengoi]|nr:hypothetical protein C8J57DRAFT_1566421 [Mycena rebaudengoi]